MKNLENLREVKKRHLQLSGCLLDKHYGGVIGYLQAIDINKVAIERLPTILIN